jgi:aldehyde:ferredoxin oxidoreductase
MTPEEFYWRNKLTNKQYLQEIRVRSLAWVLDCVDRGTIRERTIKGLISEASLIDLHKDMEEVERYEDCQTIKDVLDKIYRNEKQ